MTKKINVDFFRVSMPDGISTTFEDAIQSVIQLPAQQRVKEVRSTPVWLHYASLSQQFWECDVIRLRMTNLPVKGNLAAQVNPIDLQDDEGIGEEAAFLYHPQTRILLLQSTQSGVSISGLAKYFQIYLNCREEIQLNPVFQAEGIQRLSKMQIMRKFEVNIAGLDNLEILKEDELAVNEIIKLSEAFRAPSVNVILSVEHKREESLGFNSILRIARSLLHLAQKYPVRAKKIRVSGTDDDSESISFDLLKDLMRESMNITGQNRTIPYGIRQQALRTAWNQRQDELFSMFVPPKS